MVIMTATAFALGAIHAFDADHIAAVTAFVSKSPDTKNSLLTGLKWGLGHTSSIVIVGLIILALKLTIPPAFVSSTEFIVGVVLVALGVWLVKDLVQKKVHLHSHSHSKCSHAHFHSHKTNKAHQHSHAVTLVGALHGLAGTASVLVLVPIVLLASMQLAILYIMIFGLGTILTMALYTFFVDRVFKSLNAKTVKYAATGFVGIFNIVLGIYFMLGVI